MIKNPKESHCVWNIKIFILQGRRSRGDNFEDSLVDSLVDSLMDSLMDSLVDNFVNKHRDNFRTSLSIYATNGTDTLLSLVYNNFRH